MNLEANVMPSSSIFIAWIGEPAYIKCIELAKMFRNKKYRVEYNYVDQAIGKSLKQADKRGASYAVIIGDLEVLENSFILKNLKTGEQEKFLIE